MDRTPSEHRKGSTRDGSFLATRRMPVFACVFMLLGCLSPGRAAAREPLLGVFIEAKDLTRGEMAHVRQLAAAVGKEPWLIYGFRHGLGAASTPRHTELEVYLQPDAENGRLHRGRVLHIEFGPPAGVGGRAVPRIRSTAQYAHVVVLGRRPDEVHGKWDVHRPFVVEGDFDDETLFSLVASIRSGFDGVPRTNADSVGSVRSLPIFHVRRLDDQVEVTLRSNDYSGERVTLEKVSNRFVIVKRAGWIV